MDKNKITDVVSRKGPMLPMQLSKELGLNSIMAGAFLSELVGKKEIFCTNLKVGGSPLYYTKGQEKKLLEYTDYLKAPEKKALELLKEKKVVKDSELDSVTRVSMQNIKDFAKPIEVSVGGEKHNYWKWFLTDNEEAQSILKGNSGSEEKRSETTKEEKEETTKHEGKEPSPEDNPEEKKETDDTNTSAKPEKDVQKSSGKAEEQKAESQGHVPDEGRTSQEPHQKEDKEKGQERTSPSESSGGEDNELSGKVKSFFDSAGIVVLSQNIVRASEIEYKILIPSPVGKLQYYAVAKSKKKCSDSDLSQAYVGAQLERLPCLFIYTGELTKKAKEKLNNEFRIITTYRIKDGN